MSIISKSQLFEFGGSRGLYSSQINDSLSKSLNESKIGKTTIFLSHKHDESRELLSAIEFLKNFGISVYVDWMDEEMPKYTSGKTANRIKEKIKENRKFVLLATEGAINSKWCNWELGYGDAFKYIDHIAIFPVSNDYQTYTGSEYLDIYPVIEKVSAYSIERKAGGYFEAGYYVVSPKHPDGHKTYTKLENWLQS